MDAPISFPLHPGSLWLTASQTGKGREPTVSTIIANATCSNCKRHIMNAQGSMPRIFRLTLLEHALKQPLQWPLSTCATRRKVDAPDIPAGRHIAVIVLSVSLVARISATLWLAEQDCGMLCRRLCEPKGFGTSTWCQEMQGAEAKQAHNCHRHNNNKTKRIHP